MTESVPIAPPDRLGDRTPGFANIALLRRPADLDHATWLTRWQVDHTPVAIETQATFGYTQNVVVRPLTPDAPVIDGIVEELFPDAATTDLHAFFGAADDADLHDRMTRMVASTSAFGATDNIDTVPTSRFLLRSPFSTPDPGDHAVAASRTSAVSTNCSNRTIRPPRTMKWCATRTASGLPVPLCCAV